MPYFTELPDATIDLTASTPTLDLGTSLLLNQLHGSLSFDQYDVAANEATTLNPGDTVSLVDTNGSPALSGGTYAGTGTLSSATASSTIIGASLTIQLNPISGSYIVGDDGRVHFLTDTPLDTDHISISITGIIGLIPINLASVNISDIGSSLIGGDLVLALVQGLLDTLVVNTAYDPNAPLSLTSTEVFPCFAAGTIIDTPRGPVPVESLSVGDAILTRDHGAQTIRWIGRRHFSAAQLAASPAMVPIRINAGALGPGIPSADLIVSPQHRILVRSQIADRMFGASEILVAACQLTAIPGIQAATDLTEIEYLHILLDRHEVIHANGTETESLLLATQTIRILPIAALREILSVFLGLRSGAPAITGARPLVAGRKGRQLARRHLLKNKPMTVSPAG